MYAFPCYCCCCCCDGSCCHRWNRQRDTDSGTLCTAMYVWACLCMAIAGGASSVVCANALLCHFSLALAHSLELTTHLLYPHIYCDFFRLADSFVSCQLLNVMFFFVSTEHCLLFHSISLFVLLSFFFFSFFIFVLVLLLLFMRQMIVFHYSYDFHARIFLFILLFHLPKLTFLLWKWSNFPQDFCKIIGVLIIFYEIFLSQNNRNEICFLYLPMRTGWLEWDLLFTLHFDKWRNFHRFSLSKFRK